MILRRSSDYNMKFKLEYSQIVRRKLKILKQYLSEQYGEDFAKSAIKRITSRARELQDNPELVVAVLLQKTFRENIIRRKKGNAEIGIPLISYTTCTLSFPASSSKRSIIILSAFIVAERPSFLICLVSFKNIAISSRPSESAMMRLSSGSFSS